MPEDYGFGNVDGRIGLYGESFNRLPKAVSANYETGGYSGHFPRLFDRNLRHETIIDIPGTGSADVRTIEAAFPYTYPFPDLLWKSFDQLNILAVLTNITSQTNLLLSESFPR